MAIFISGNLVAQDLKMYSEEWPPINFTENGKKVGVSMDLLGLMLKKMGSSKTVNDVEMVPWSRGYNIIQNDKNVMLFAMTRTEERESLFKWVCAITRNETHVWARSDSSVVISSKADLSKFKYATVQDDAAEQMILKLGVSKSNLERASNYLSNAKKLSAGRVDLVVDNIKGMKENARKMNVPFSNFKSVLSTS